VQRIRELSRTTVMELLGRPGIPAVHGRRDRLQALDADAVGRRRLLTEALHGGTHLQAMREFAELADAGATHFFTAQRVGPFLQRCAACGNMNTARPSGTHVAPAAPRSTRPAEEGTSPS